MKSTIASLRKTPRRLLARLQLLQIVPTSRHVASGLVKALRELRRIRCTGPAGRLLAVAARLAVVKACIHGLGVRIGGVLLVGLVVVGLCWGGGFGRRRRSAAEEPADCMADGGAHCYATGGLLVFGLAERRWMQGVRTYAAVDAIWPNKPGDWVAGAAGA